MEQELEAIGIPTELTIVDWATLTDYRKDPDKFDLYIIIWFQIIFHLLYSIKSLIYPILSFILDKIVIFACFI